MAGDTFDHPRLTALELFIEVHVALTTRTASVFAEHRLSGVPDFDTLIRLARSPGQRLRMTDLAAQTSLSTSGLTRVVDRLERNDLVYREACPADRRSSLAVLTQGGADRLSAVLPELLDSIERWFTGLLTAEQLDGLLAALHIVRDTVRPGAAAGAGG